MNETTEARREYARANPRGRAGEATVAEFKSEMRAATKQVDGKEFIEVEGYASTTERGYEMWDFFGQYTERIARDAFDKTLGSSPDVAFLLNHRGMTMARTTNGTLDLSADSLGLRSVARLNPQRQDVRDLALAIEDENIDQMSFAFEIVRGEWNDAFDEYTIQEVNLNRGDVSAVNYGANPHTSISARAAMAFRAIDLLEGAPLRAARDRAAARIADPPAASLNPSKGTLRALRDL